MDDEITSIQFYAIDVKYNASFDSICCFCAPYHGDVAAAMLLAVGETIRAMTMSIFTIINLPVTIFSVIVLAMTKCNKFNLVSFHN